jgi:D-lactate dehydrogenase
MTTKVAFFSTKPYDRQWFDEQLKHTQDVAIQISYFEDRLTQENTGLAKGFPIICCFVNDVLDAKVLEELAQGGTKHIALRCAGFDMVDLQAAAKLGITVSRVPSYSPYAVAEHALAMIMTLNRKTHRAYNRTREGDYSIGGLLGFDINGRTAGIIGTGKIGAVLAKILQAMGCKVLAYDIYQDKELAKAGIQYVDLDTVLSQSDIISLHAPLTPQTKHMINDQAIAKMKQGVMLVNTSRGALIDTKALIHGLKSKKFGAVGLDVYEFEKGLFFENHKDEIIQDDLLQRLTTFPNVLITAHQAFFTKEAVTAIAEQTVDAMQSIAKGEPMKEKYIVKAQ